MTQENRAGRRLLPVTLAYWQLRQTWRLLLLTGCGIIAAVIIVCAVPLYTQIALTAEIENALRASNTSGDLQAQASAGQVQPVAIQRHQAILDHIMQSNLGDFLYGQTQFSFVMTGVDLFRQEPMPQGHPSFSKTGNQLNLIGQPGDQIASHLTLLAGKLPSANSNPVDIDITPSTAISLGAYFGGPLKVGSRIVLQIPFDTDAGQRITVHYLTLRVAGLFRPKVDTFWHDNSFECVPLGKHNETCGALASNTALIAALNAFNTDPTLAGLHIETTTLLSWFYHVDVSRITDSNKDQALQGLNVVTQSLSPVLNDPPFIEGTTFVDPLYGLMQQFSNLNVIAQIPIASLSLLVIGLTLFFVALMNDILIDRQSDTIAVLRSRGASRWQVFSAFLVQGIGIALAAFIVGPLLALIVTPLVSLSTLSPMDAQAVEIVSLEPLVMLQQVAMPALITVGVALLAMLVSTMGSMQRGILSLRREAARSTHRPLWQRLNVDIFVAVIALTGFGFSLYETSPGVLDARVRVLVLPPLTLVGVIALLLGVSLLLLRGFPLILNLGAKAATRGQGATPMLALTQMARTPRQSLRMTMLLAFSIAFAIFALVFNASQTQRILDVADYEVGADFSGSINNTASLSYYNHIPGVLATTAGYTSSMNANDATFNIQVQMLAADASTFAKTLIWTGQDSSQPIAPLMQQLVTLRPQSAARRIIPAVVDTSTSNILHLARGSTFVLSDENGPITCYVIAEVQRIPTINDSDLATGTSDITAAGGVLIDYQSYLAVLQKVNGQTPLGALIWLKTRGDPASLASVRRALTNGPMALSSLNDRRAIIDNLSNDPVYVDLTGLLVMSVAIAILLALAGSLIASWLSVRDRLTNFAVLRALGTTPRQLASILTWEQGISYAIALILGVAFGIVLSALALPSLIFTNVAVSGLNLDLSNGQTYILQSIPPVQVIIPPSLWIVFAFIVAICLAALLVMVRAAARPSVSQTLRLNED